MFSHDKKSNRPLDVLLVEDSQADIKIAQRAFEKSATKTNLFIARDGVDAVRFLKHEAPYEDQNRFPRPDIILLDINMPKVNGLDVLKSLKNNNLWRGIPVVMFTTSQDESDISRSYELGASGFIPKPVTYEAFVDVVQLFSAYWGKLVRLPKLGKEI